jgi:D-alanyl-lipoteichoic acid acyltransferase DltB (MBOAT superfamily)
MTWDWRYAGLILFSTVVDFAVGLGMVRTKSRDQRRMLLMVSLVTNLGLLFVFKYFNFFVDSAVRLSNSIGLPVEPMSFQLLLPVGISFYTFQTLSYSIDLYRGRIEVERKFLRFALFVAFFPQLVAGPIVRASDFLPQLAVRRSCGSRRFRAGLLLILIGLFKKVALADVIGAVVVDPVFADPANYSLFGRYIALVGYACQIYNDFSGYSDIAIGSAKIFGFDLPQNFNAPYLAVNVRDFWTRWHISLSTWLRDYLYFAMGGNRRGKSRTYVNLMVTMLLGGLWHGAAWNFVLWGAFHGTVLVGSHAFRARTGGPRLLRQLLTFHIVLFGWLLFRVASMNTFVTFFEIPHGTVHALPIGAVSVVLAALLVHYTPNSWVQQMQKTWLACPPVAHGAALALAILFLIGIAVDSPNFIYFQF